MSNNLKDTSRLSDKPTLRLHCLQRRKLSEIERFATISTSGFMEVADLRVQLPRREAFRSGPKVLGYIPIMAPQALYHHIRVAGFSCSVWDLDNYAATIIPIGSYDKARYRNHAEPTANMALLAEDGR